MDVREQTVARRLAQLDADHRVSPAAAEGILGGALRTGERRRRRRRVLGSVGAAAACAAVVAGVLVVGTVDDRRAGPVDLPAPPVPLQDSTLRTELAVLLGSTTAQVLPREHGRFDLRAYDLAPDGTLFGAEQRYDRNWFDTWGRAQTADLQTGRLESYDIPRGDPLVGGDGQTRLTLEHVDPRHKFDLFCTPRVGGTRTQLSDASVAESSVRIDAGHVVWSTYPDGDGPYRAWVADGCSGLPRALDVPGVVRAVSWPRVYLSTTDDRWLVQVDAETGERVDLAAPQGLSPDLLPGAVGAADHLDVDASGPLLAWTVHDALIVVDTDANRVVVSVGGLPPVTGANGSVVRATLGDRFVAWSSSPVDGDPATSRGVLVELGSGRMAEVDGEVWAAGPWVVWLAEDGYRVVRTG